MAEPFKPQDFSCPTCGAHPQEPCRLRAGGVRFQPHVERFEIAEGFEAERFVKEIPPGDEPPAREPSD